MSVGKNDLKVGAFVLFGLLLAGLVIFLIGDERRVFETSVYYDAQFENVEGLTAGAPVRMGGVRIGQVSRVRYKEDATDGMVHVSLRVVSEDAKRIREDSRVHIVNKGLLGDKMLEIDHGTVGDQLPPGSIIPSATDDDLMGKVDSIATEAEATLRNVRDLAEALGDEQLHEDVRESARSVNVLLKEVTQGQGYPHRFLSDPHEAERISSTIESLSDAATELKYTLREVRLAVRQVRKGPGFAHDMIYGDGAEKEIAQFGAAADEVALTLRGIRQGDGFMRDVLFGGNGDTRDAISNVNQLTADLRDIVRGVKDGKGTVGALLVDPSIYEDMKRILGDVERNDVLRAIVRYSIKKDRPAPKVEVERADAASK